MHPVLRYTRLTAAIQREAIAFQSRINGSILLRGADQSELSRAAGTSVPPGRKRSHKNFCSTAGRPFVRPIGRQPAVATFLGMNGTSPLSKSQSASVYVLWCTIICMQYANSLWPSSSGRPLLPALPFSNGGPTLWPLVTSCTCHCFTRRMARCFWPRPGLVCHN